jgi:BASS family bile acid:Na+ symporter
VLHTLIEYAIPTTTFLLLTAVGLDLTSADFSRVRRQPKVVAAGLLAPLVVLPPIAVTLVWLFRPAPEVAGSMLLIASSPIGGISNTYSYLARASTALSVTLTALSCMAATVTIPILGKAFQVVLHQPLGLSAPAPLLIGQLALMLGLPVGIGMLVRWRAPALALRLGPALARLTLAGTAVILALIIADAPGLFVTGLTGTVPLAVVFVIASVAAGWLTGGLVTPDGRDRFTLAAEFGTRNVAVALAIAVTMLGRTEFARFALIYALVEIPLLLAMVGWYRRRQTRREMADLAPDGLRQA